MDPINQTNISSGGSKKGLYIVIGVLVLLLVGGYLYMKNNSSGIDVDRHLDGSTTTTTPYGSVTTNTNKLPDNWPSDVPTYPNADITQAISLDSQIVGSEGGQMVYLNSTDNSQTVSAFYESKLLTLGWASMYPGVSMSKSFAGTGMGDITNITAKKDNRMLTIMITNLKTGGSMITLSNSIISESLQKSLDSMSNSQKPNTSPVPKSQ